MVEITNREDYDALLKRGIDCLYDKRYHLEIGLRREIQREKFGKNDDAGNAKFYAYCIKHFPHVCENCGKPIPHPWATNVSHILSRGAFAPLSHDCRNVSILCWECHQKYEHKPTRVTMNPWYLERVERRIEMLKEEYRDFI
jgi:hypothetical protein